MSDWVAHPLLSPHVHAEGGAAVAPGTGGLGDTGAIIAADPMLHSEQLFAEDSAQDIFVGDNAVEEQSEEAAWLADLPFRAWVANLLQRPGSSTPATVLHYVIITLIFGSTALTILETMPEMRDYKDMFLWMDRSVSVLFASELAARFYVSESCCAFCSDCFNIVDMLAILPSCFDISAASSSLRTLRLIRMFRLARVIRVVRLAKHWQYAHQMRLLLQVLSEVSKSAVYAIGMLLTGAMVVSASLLYLFEAPQCVDDDAAQFIDDCRVQSHFSSIPASCWWAVTTLTTVGYGDVVPATVMGKVVGGAMAVGGAVLLAISAALISIHVRVSWPEERAKAHFHRMTAEVPQLAQDREEIEGLLSVFHDNLNALLGKVTNVTIQIEQEQSRDDASPAMMPYYKSLKEQSLSLSSEISAYVYEALLEAARRPPRRHSSLAKIRSSGASASPRNSPRNSGARVSSTGSPRGSGASQSRARRLTTPVTEDHSGDLPVNTTSRRHSVGGLPSPDRPPDAHQRTSSTPHLGSKHYE